MSVENIIYKIYAILYEKKHYKTRYVQKIIHNYIEIQKKNQYKTCFETCGAIIVVS